jgi:Holliday junction resolvase
MLETTITNKILKYLNGLPGCKAEKRHGSQYSEAGAPDISACYKGQSIQIEVKRPGEQPTPIQHKRLRQWAEAGAFTGWVTSVEEVKHLMSGIMK